MTLHWSSWESDKTRCQRKWEMVTKSSIYSRGIVSVSIVYLVLPLGGWFTSMENFFSVWIYIKHYEGQKIIHGSKIHPDFCSLLISWCINSASMPWVSTSCPRPSSGRRQWLRPAFLPFPSSLSLSFFLFPSLFSLVFFLFIFYFLALSQMSIPLPSPNRFG